MDEKLQKIMEVTSALRSEKDINSLLELILVRAMELATCEAGTMFLVHKKYLYFQVIRNNKMPQFNRNRATCTLPPVPIREEYACARALMERKNLRINDAYDMEEQGNDFSGPEEYDEKSGYHTQSMMAIPLITREGEKLGVLQLINCLDADGNYRGFLPEHELLIGLFADQATLALEQAKLQAQVQGMEWILGQSKRGSISDKLQKELYEYIEKNYCKDMNPQEFNEKLGGQTVKKKSSSGSIREQLTRKSSLQDIHSALDHQTRESAKEKLYAYVVSSGKRDAEIAKEAGMSRASFYHCLNGNRTITKNYMFAIAVALGLSSENLEELLMLNGYCFQPDSKRDLAIKYLFEVNDRYEQASRLNLMDFNIILDEIGVEPLGEKSR